MVTTQRKPKQLGQILLEQGLISEEHLQRALEEHRNTPKSLGRVLIDLAYIKERDLVRALAEQVGLAFVDLTEYRIDAAATALLPEALCRRYRAGIASYQASAFAGWSGETSALLPERRQRLIKAETYLAEAEQFFRAVKIKPELEYLETARAEVARAQAKIEADERAQPKP